MKVKHNKRYRILLLFFLLGSFSDVTQGLSNEVVDHSLYDQLLKKYVKNGVVNYQGFKNEENKLDQYLEVLRKTDTKRLSHNEQFAFYVNTYNAWTIKLVLSGYPGIESIKDLGSFLESPWRKKLCHIDGQFLTLDDLEHHILRHRFKDSRVHFAINCAAKSCPPLISEPYRGSTLDQQLDDSARRFINNPLNNRFEGDTLYVSRIFKWFAEDFNNNIAGFFLQYAEDPLKQALGAKMGKIKIKYLDYDWSLNGY